MDQDAVHKFMGDAREPFARTQDHILCLSTKDDMELEQTAVTTRFDDVTCQDCINSMVRVGNDC